MMCVTASIFAYGQTSSGKTFTMTGITEYTLADIYDYIQKHTEREFILKFSAMEIYNECVRDHLSTDSTPLRLLDDPEVNSFSFNTGIHMFLLHDSYLLRKRGTIVEKLTKETLRDWNHVMVLLSICEGSVMHSSVANPREPTVGQSIGQTTPAALGNENSAQPATVGAAGSSPSIRRSEVRVVPLRTAITN